MTKFQEALDVIARYISDIRRGISRYSENIINEKLCHLKELVDKATPKEPIYEDLDCYIACPNCWGRVDDLSSVLTDDLIEPKYCPHCGQKLDWSDYGKTSKTRLS